MNFLQQTMECACKFAMQSAFYTCIIKDLDISEPGIKLSVKGKHFDGHSNNDVTDIWMRSITYMPTGLGELFPNLEMINLDCFFLRTITKNDLIGMPNLEEIYIECAQIKYIPRDLFEYTRNLKKIVFKEMPTIRFIEEGLIDGLEKLELFCIDSCTLIYTHKAREELTKIKAELKPYLPNDEEREKYYKVQKRLEEFVKIRSATIRKLENMSKAFESLLESGRFSDMKIIIEDETFKVHKLVLGAHSLVLADIFEKNEDMKELNLKEIKKETFKIILSFIYKEELPAADANYAALYSASVQLKIVELMQICEERVEVEEGNVDQVVSAAKKVGLQKLRDEGFKFVRNMFPECNISKNLIENPEDLKKALEMKKSLNIILQKQFKKR